MKWSGPGLLGSLWLVVASSVPGAQQAREVGLSKLPPSLLETLHWMFPVEDGDARDAAFGDVDGDGDLDAYLAVWGPDELFLNDGFGGFERAPHRLPDTGDRTIAVTLLDVEGDGDLDVFAVNAYPPRRHELYLNDGSGRFTVDTDARVPAGVDPESSVAAGDVDGDLDLDLLIGVAGQNLLYLNDGSGHYTDATGQLPAILDLTQGVVLADVDGDHSLDAFVANASGGVFTDPQNRLLLNLGNGVFVDVTSALPADGDESVAAALADLNGDGWLDIVVANDGQNRLYLNDGTSGFNDATAGLPSALDRSSSVALGDVDGDDAVDVVFSNSRLGQISPVNGEQNVLLLNDGAAIFQDETGRIAGVLDATHAARLADVDGDGDLDLFAANDGLDVLQLNDGDGNFTLVAGRTAPFHDRTNAAALGDVDGDGDQDVLTGNGRHGSSYYPAFETQNRLYLNQGGNRFVEATNALPPSSLMTTSVALGDVEGDGDLDALMGNPLDGDLSGIYLTQENNLYLNRGGTTFADATDHLPTFPGEERGVTLGVYLADVDGDADLDILLAKVNDYDGGGGGCSFYRNVGAAQFVDASLEVPGGGGYDVQQVAVGDLNRDGRLDVVTACNPAYNYVLLNDGLGGFVDASNLLPPLDSWDQSYGVSLGDFEADGDLDIFFANVGGPDRLYVNRMGSVARGFTDGSELLPARVDHGRFVDLDRNGFPELVGRDQLLFNARGVFVPAGELLPELRPYLVDQIVFGDLDRDGDTDALVARDSLLVWSNLIRHLSWRNVPRIGKELVLDVHGPRGEPWSLFLSGATRETRTPWGTFFLDPAGLQHIGSGMLDGDGRSAPAYAPPADPALVGLDFYVQAFVGVEPRLTNLEVLTLTDL